MGTRSNRPLSSVPGCSAGGWKTTSWMGVRFLRCVKHVRPRCSAPVIRSFEISTTLAGLFTPLLFADLSFAVRALLRSWLNDEIDDGLAYGGQARPRGWTGDSVFPARLERDSDAGGMRKWSRSKRSAVSVRLGPPDVWHYCPARPGDFIRLRVQRPSVSYVSRADPTRRGWWRREAAGAAALIYIICSTCLH